MNPYAKSNLDEGRAVRYTDWIIKNRWLVLIFSLLMAFALASGAQYLSLGTNYRIFFSKDNPDLIAFDAVENIYTKDDNVFFIIQPDEGTVFNTKTLSLVRELTEESWQVPYSIRVDSLSNFQHTFAEGDDLIVEDLIPKKGELSSKIIARAKDVSNIEPILYKRLLSENNTTTAVNVRIQLAGKDPMETLEVSGFARKLRDRMKEKYPQHTIMLTGLAMLNNAYAETPMTDAPFVMPIMFGGFVLMMLIYLRSGLGTFVTMSVVTLSALAAVGVFGFLRSVLDPVSASAPTIILTLGVADSIHILVTFFGAMRSGMSRQDAIRESMRVNAQPVFLTSVTTAIGFLSLNFSDAPPFQLLGNITAVGVIFAWFYSITFLPAALAIIPLKVKTTHTDSKNYMDRFADIVVTYYKPLGIVTGVLTILLFVSMLNLSFNDRYHEYFSKSLDFRNASDFSLKHLPGLYRTSYSLESGESNGVSEPAFLHKVDEFSQWLRKQPEVTHISSFSDTMKRLNKNLNGDDESFYRIPDNKELGAQYLLLYEMSLPYGLDVNDQINIDKSSLRLDVTYGDTDLKDLENLNARANNWLKENTDGPMSEARGAGTGLMFANITRRNINSMVLGTLIGFFLISVILAVALKSFRMGVISLIPNILPSVMAFGVWSYFVGTVGFAISVVAGLSIGIIVDDTVHFLSKYQRARREHGMSAEEAVRFAFHTVGSALLGTTVIIGIGFLLLGLSNFRVTAYMGYLTSLAIVCALITDFFLLPALLIALDKKKEEVGEKEVEDSVAYTN